MFLIGTHLAVVQFHNICVTQFSDVMGTDNAIFIRRCSLKASQKESDNVQFDEVIRKRLNVVLVWGCCTD